LPAATSEERLEQYDHVVEEIKRSFAEALRHLEEEPAVRDSFEDRLRDLAVRLKELGDTLRPEDFDKEQGFALFRAFLAVRDLVDEAGDSPDLDTCNELLINIERIRHVFRDAIDEHVTGVGDDRRLVLADLRKWLPKTPQATLAALIGVDRRTLTRWAKEAGGPSPRLQLIARLVAILQHNWTEEGVVAWFDRPRRDLDGRRPRALLSDATNEDALIMAARSGRAQYAT
jgi:DNA-binding XRE family transcriptional regulator